MASIARHRPMAASLDGGTARRDCRQAQTLFSAAEWTKRLNGAFSVTDSVSALTSARPRVAPSLRLRVKILGGDLSADQWRALADITAQLPAGVRGPIVNSVRAAEWTRLTSGFRWTAGHPARLPRGRRRVDCISSMSSPKISFRRCPTL